MSLAITVGLELEWLYIYIGTARIKRYRIAFFDALFMVCDATSILRRKIIQPTKVQLVAAACGAVPESQIGRVCVRFHFFNIVRNHLD